MQSFFAEYTELKHRPFFITGESYGGIYLPYLVSKLVDEPLPYVNLQGFAVGNPYTDAVIDGNAYMNYFYTHAMISYENYQEVVHACDSIGKCMYTSTNCSMACTLAIKEGILEADTDQLNPYYIYGDKCLLQNNQAGSLRYTTRKVPTSPEARRGKIGPCADEFTEAYLNLPQVRDAIHAGHDVKHWKDCNNVIAQGYSRAPSALPQYRHILKDGNQMRILIYSGDADSVVNFLGTEEWIASFDGLALTVKKKWEAWFGPDKQLAGYVQEYNGLTFMTIKGAGHMVPAIRPLHALNMFECFIFEDLCKTLIIKIWGSFQKKLTFRK